MTEIVGTRPAATGLWHRGRRRRPRRRAGPAAASNRASSWVAAGLTLGLLSVSYGSPLLAVVGLKPITEDLGTQRQLVALVSSLTWLGTGLGGVVMGQVAERIGIRATVMFGATMIALGLAVSASGNLWAMLVGHAVLVGFLGNGALYPPLIVYVSRWFDRRRGTALGADFVRPIHRRHGLADPVRARRCAPGYALARARMMHGLQRRCSVAAS